MLKITSSFKVGDQILKNSTMDIVRLADFCISEMISGALKEIKNNLSESSLQQVEYEIEEKYSLSRYNDYRTFELSFWLIDKSEFETLSAIVHRIIRVLNNNNELDLVRQLKSVLYPKSEFSSIEKHDILHRMEELLKETM